MRLFDFVVENTQYKLNSALLLSEMDIQRAQNNWVEHQNNHRATYVVPWPSAECINSLPELVSGRILTFDGKAQMCHHIRESTESLKVINGEVMAC